MNGSAATTGAAKMRATVSAFGRFIALHRAPSGERFQYELAHRLERIEYSVSRDRDRLEVWCPLHPLSSGNLIDEILSRVIWIGSYPLLLRLEDLEPGIERGLKLGHRRRIREIAFVVLYHERHRGEIIPVLLHVLVQVLHRFLIRLHSLQLRIGHEHDSIHTLQDQLAAGVVVYLAGHRVEMEARLEPANRPEIHRKEIEEERALGFGRERNQLAARARLHSAVHVLEVRGLAAQPGTVVHDLAA